LTSSSVEFRAKIRDDLIRRLFAVAISVGAATTIAKMDWVDAGHWPCLAEWQQIFILVAAMTATVLSWDGYLLSIADRPLTNFWRFAIDIVLVFIYMVLLMTSKLLVWWLFLHAFVYALYAVWDLLSIFDWKSKYYTESNSSSQTVRGVYIGGLINRVGVSRGPIITLGWGLYFWGLYILNDRALHWIGAPGLSHRIFGTTIFVVLGLIFYRQDKARRFTMQTRLGLIACLLLASAAYLAWLPIDETLWTWVGPYIGSASCSR
jgi:hypothetical protein